MNKKDTIIQLLKQGKSFKEIAKVISCSPGLVSYHAHRIGLEVEEKYHKRYDWNEIQKYYDEGHGMRECMRYFGFHAATWVKAIERGAIHLNPHVIPLEDLLVSDRKQTSRSYLKHRLIQMGILKKECAICKITEW